MSKGLILPAGSPLVQFEIKRPPNGQPNNAQLPLPAVIWVIRMPEERTDFVCKCSSVVWRVSRKGLPKEYMAKYTGVECVCRCMGGFIE